MKERKRTWFFIDLQGCYKTENQGNIKEIGNVRKIKEKSENFAKFSGKLKLLALNMFNICVHHSYTVLEH